MTTPIRLYPFGPVRPLNDITLAIVVNKVIYTAVYISGEIVFVPLHVGSTLNPLVSDDTILVFQINGTTSNFTAKLSKPAAINGKIMSVNNKVLSLGNGDTFILTSKYSDPPPEYVLFSSVDYTFNSNNSAVGVNYMPGNNTNILSSTTIYTICTSYFDTTDSDQSVMRCTSGAEHPIGALTAFDCSFSGSCPDKILFTRNGDCIRNLIYDYCLEDQRCGECLGKCSSTDGTCDYNSPNSNLWNSGNTEPFVCSDASKVPLILPFYQQTWFLILIILLIVIAIIVIIYYRLHKEPMVTTQPITTRSTLTKSTIIQPHVINPLVKQPLVN